MASASRPCIRGRALLLGLGIAAGCRNPAADLEPPADEDAANPEAPISEPRPAVDGLEASAFEGETLDPAGHGHGGHGGHGGHADHSAHAGHEARDADAEHEAHDAGAKHEPHDADAEHEPHDADAGHAEHRDHAEHASLSLDASAHGEAPP